MRQRVGLGDRQLTCLTWADISGRPTVDLGLAGRRVAVGQGPPGGRLSRVAAGSGRRQGDPAKRLAGGVIERADDHDLDRLVEPERGAQQRCVGGGIARDLAGKGRAQAARARSS